MEQKLFDLYKEISRNCNNSNFEINFEELEIIKRSTSPSNKNSILDKNILLKDFYESDLYKKILDLNFNDKFIFMYKRKHKKAKKGLYKLSFRYDKFDIIFIAKLFEGNHISFLLEIKDIYSGYDIKENNTFFERFNTKILDDIFKDFKLHIIKKEKKLSLIYNDYYRNNPTSNKILRTAK